MISDWCQVTDNCGTVVFISEKEEEIQIFCCNFQYIDVTASKYIQIKIAATYIR